MFKKLFKKTSSQTEQAPLQVIRDDRPTVQISKSETEEIFPKDSAMACETHIGTREYQQDAVYLSEVKENYLYGILCDGMGGMADGERVSSDVVSLLANKLENVFEDISIPDLLEREIHYVNEQILCENEKENMNAGSTLVVVVIRKNRLFWASVGDSRIYLVRGNEIAQMTRDHNYALKLREQVKKGLITQAEAEKDPQKEALISYMGADLLELIDVSRGPFLLDQGDYVLLCSDGLTKSLTDVEILEIITEYGKNAKEAAHMLINMAFDKGNDSKDNTSVILIRYPYE